MKLTDEPRDGIQSSRIRLAAILILAALTASWALVASAGTQDFRLVNQVGEEVYRVYISETTNDDWEEDVLGEDVLPNGDYVDINFEGRSACLWDIMISDEEENTVVWNAINLCKVSVVVLHCNQKECWAEYE